jgi:hypothetical protein
MSVKNRTLGAASSRMEQSMNRWIGESIKIANSAGYLDRLSEIYEMQINPERPLKVDIVAKIKKAFEENNEKELIRSLIKNAAVFPVKDSYIGFLRKKEKAIDENPKTIKRIAERLRNLGFEKMIQEASRPKETNRQLGNAFKKWLGTLGYDVAEEDIFLKMNNRTMVLKGSDKSLASFAKEKLNCELKKGIDFVIKKNDKYVIGEAKFLTTPGGEQDRGFDDAESFVHEKSGKAIRIAILDGYIWLVTLSGIHDKIRQSDDNIMSALLLKEFIESL